MSRASSPQAFYIDQFNSVKLLLLLLLLYFILFCTLLEKRRLALKSHPIKHTNTLEESRAPPKNNNNRSCTFNQRACSLQASGWITNIGNTLL